MSFITNVENGEEVVFLGLIKPSARLFGLEQQTPSHVYSVSLKASFVNSFKFNTTSFSSVSELSDLDTPSANRYYFDRSQKILYLDLSSQGAPSSSDVLVVDYEFHLASKEIIFNRDPEDNVSDLVSYEPYLESNISLAKSIDNNIDGFMPALSSRINLINTDYEVSSMLDRATLSRKEALFYAIAGELTQDNLFRYISGVINSISMNDSDLTLNISDLIFNFDGTYELLDSVETYDQAQSTLSDLDPDFVGVFIPRVFGTVNSLPCANYEYVAEGAGFSSNNNHIICKHYGGSLNSNALTFTIVSSGSTSTVLSTADGITAGDEITIVDGGFLKHYCFVTSVNYGTNTISHSDGRDFSPSNGTILYKHRICNVHLVNLRNLSGTAYKRNDDPGDSTAQTYRLELVDSIPNPWKVLRIKVDHFGDLSDDKATYTKFFARVMGEPVGFDLNGSPMELSDRGYHSKAHQVIYQYLLEQVGFSTGDLDLDSFEALESDLANQFDVGFTIPFQDSVNSIPNHRDVISRILKSSFLSIYQNELGKISLARLNKISSAPVSINSDEILSLSYNESFQDTSKTSRISFRRSTSPIGPKTSSSDGSALISNYNNRFDTFTDSKISALHSTTRTKNLETVLWYKDQASDFAEKYFTIFGYGFNTFDVTLPLNYANLNIGDFLSIDRKLLPGALDLSETNSILVRVLSIDTGSKEVKITVWTQRGIQDSQGVW